MIISVPKEIKPFEYRVGMTPRGVEELTRLGLRVLVEGGAGAGSGFSDGEYEKAGALIVDRKRVWEEASLVVKVKEPLEEEFPLLREDGALFTFLHLAAQEKLTNALLRKKVPALAYETVTDERGSLPLLKPMSEVAGALAFQAGAKGLEKVSGGRGILLPGLSQSPPGKVAIIGAGIAGTMAARVATGAGADVTVIDINASKLERVRDITYQRAKTSLASANIIAGLLRESDLVILAVLLPGKSAPKIIRREMLETMKEGSCIVDISIDQGGAAETSRATTHEAPYFSTSGVVHYCVTNIPSAVPRTSTLALTAMTLPLVRNIASLGLEKALLYDEHLRRGLNTFKGHITCSGLAESLHLDFVPPEDLLRL